MKRVFLVVLAASPLLGVAALPWNKPLADWTPADAELVLSDSPWARVTASKIAIRWESAQPVRQARRKLETGAVIPDDGRCCAIAVSGIGTGFEKPSRLDASLRPAGRDAIPAKDVKVLEGLRGGTHIVFHFPIEQFQEPVVFRFPLGVKLRNHIEFHARIGALEIKQKFSLNSMMYGGKLVL